VIRLSRSDIAVALVAIACGGYILLMAAGVLPGEMTNDTPLWVGGLAGFVFVLAGVMIFLRNHSRALDLAAAIILSAFALMAAWVAGYGSEGMSGGMLFLPHEWNISIGRALFGFGSVLCMLGVAYALRRFFGSHK
jgi:hypothetical protein